MKNRDLFSSLFWMGFGTLFLFGSLQQDLIRKGVPGPGFLPFIIGVILILLSLMLLIPALSNKKEGLGAIERGDFFSEKDGWKKILLALVALFAYGILLGHLGYFLSTFLFMLFISRLIEPQRWRTVIILALSTALLSYLLFVVLLKVQLPKGILGI